MVQMAITFDPERFIASMALPSPSRLLPVGERRAPTRFDEPMIIAVPLLPLRRTRGRGPRGALYTALTWLALLLTIMTGRPAAQTPAPGEAPAPTPVPGSLETRPSPRNGRPAAQTLAPGEAPAPTPTPGPLETLPSPHERLLAPVPTQFNWLQRETPSNPFLESLLSVYGRTRFIVSTSLAEEVSDNFEQDSSGEIDARTTVVLGTVYRLDDGQNFVSLANTTNAFYQVGSGESRIGYANLALNAGYQLPPLSFGLTESFSRDDNTGLDTTTPLLGPQQRFIRNSISPQVRYDFSPLTAATLAYTHTLVINEGSDQGNTTTHAVSPGLQHQFSRNLTASAQYTFTAFHGSDATSSGDVKSRSHGLTTEAGYQLNAKTSASLRVFGALVDRSGTGAQDSSTYGASIGARYALSPRVNFAGSAGPTALKRQGDNVKVSANYQLSLDGQLPFLETPALTFFLSTRQSVEDTVAEVNNVGFVLRREAEARLTYAPLTFFSSGLFFTYSRNEFLEDVNTGAIAGGQGQIENLSSIGVTASYALTRILSLTGTYRYQRRDSDQPENDFAENRVTIALTGTFPLF